MLIILKVLILMKFYNSVKYVYKCMCFGNASYPILVLDTGKGCYICGPETTIPTRPRIGLLQLSPLRDFRPRKSYRKRGLGTVSS